MPARRMLAFTFGSRRTPRWPPPRRRAPRRPPNPRPPPPPPNPPPRPPRPTTSTSTTTTTEGATTTTVETTTTHGPPAETATVHALPPAVPPARGEHPEAGRADRLHGRPKHAEDRDPRVRVRDPPAALRRIGSAGLGGARGHEGRACRTSTSSTRSSTAIRSGWRCWAPSTTRGSTASRTSALT